MNISPHNQPSLDPWQPVDELDRVVLSKYRTSFNEYLCTITATSAEIDEISKHDQRFNEAAFGSEYSADNLESILSLLHNALKTLDVACHVRKTCINARHELLINGVYAAAAAERGDYAEAQRIEDSRLENVGRLYGIPVSELVSINYQERTLEALGVLSAQLLAVLKNWNNELRRESDGPFGGVALMKDLFREMTKDGEIPTRERYQVFVDKTAEDLSRRDRSDPWNIHLSAVRKIVVDAMGIVMRS